MTQLSLGEFYVHLKRHDWTYMMSDDPGVYRRGSEFESKLKAMAKTSPEHLALFDAYQEFVWGRGPKPEDPND